MAREEWRAAVKEIRRMARVKERRAVREPAGALCQHEEQYARRGNEVLQVSWRGERDDEAT